MFLRQKRCTWGENRKNWKLEKNSLLYLCHNEPTCQNCVCRSNGVAWANTKAKRKKLKKVLKTYKFKLSKNVRKKISISPKEHISKKIRLLGRKLWRWHSKTGIFRTFRKNSENYHFPKNFQTIGSTEQLQTQ